MRIHRYYLVAGLIALTGLGAAQDEKPTAAPTVRPAEESVRIKDIVALLDLGVSEEEVLALCERRGWPDKVTTSHLLELRRHGAGTKLQQAVLKRIRTSTELRRLPEQFRIFEAREFSLLVPRGWKTEEASLNGRRFSFHEHEEAGWFRRTTMFVWMFDAGAWERDNEAALARICLDVARAKLAKGGFTPGDASRDVVVHQRTRRTYPLYHTLCRDPHSGLRGLLAVTCRVDPVSGRLAVLGFTTRVPADENGSQRPRDLLAEMVTTLRFRPDADAKPSPR